MTRMYLQVTLPALPQPATQGSGTNTTPGYAHWVNAVGEALIKSVEIEIGGSRIDKHYGEFLEVWQELTCPSEQMHGYGKLVNKQYVSGSNMPKDKATAADLDPLVTFSKREQTLYIPLQFWFNNNPGLALPLIALSYHEVKVNFEFRPLAELIRHNGVSPAYSIPNLSLGAATLYVDYVYLDTEERRRFAQVSHEYLIEQLQFTGAESLPSTVTNQKVRLNFNHPTKELIWFVTDDTKAVADPVNGNLWFDFGETQAQQPISAVKILLNGHDRFSERPGSYFSLVQPYQHHTRVPARNIYVYSFALKPEEYQPSGSLNFSRINRSVRKSRTPETCGPCFRESVCTPTHRVYSVQVCG